MEHQECTGPLSPPSAAPCVASNVALGRCNDAAQSLVGIARLLISQPLLVSHTSPFVCLCLFIAGRYLIVSRVATSSGESNFTDGDEIATIKEALSYLGKIFAIAGTLPRLSSNGSASKARARRPGGHS